MASNERPRATPRKDPGVTRVPAHSGMGGMDGMKDLVQLWSDAVYWEQDAEFRLTLATGAMLAQAQIEPSFYVGKTPWELDLDPLDDDGWDAHKSQLRARKPFAHFAIGFATPHGERRYLSASAQPRFAADGAFLGYRGIARDVTPSVRLEQRRRIEQEATRALADSTTLQDAIDGTIAALCDTLGWVCGVYWEIDAESHLLECACTWARDHASARAFVAELRELSPLRVPSSELLRRVCTSSVPVWIADMRAEASLPCATQAVTSGLVGALFFPVLTEGRTTGVVACFSRTHERADDEIARAIEFLGVEIGRFAARRRAQAELHRFRAAMDMSGDQIYLVDRSTMRFVDVNQTAVDATGYTREELLAMGPQNLVMADRQDLERSYDAVIAAGSTGVTTEIEGRGKDGTRAVVELHRRALLADGRWLIVTISRDVTQRKRAEQAALRLRRMYAALSSTNDAILRVKSAEELYQRVCEAAVEGGKFLTTAVIIPDEVTGETRIAAAAGERADSLHRVGIALDDSTPEGRGLVGTAFRSHTHCVSNDFLKDDRVSPWHRVAQRVGIASAAALPFARGDRTFGVLVFYSNEKRAFDEEIVALLRRMTENIAFALDTFEQTEERRRAEDRIQYLATHDGLTGLPNRVMFNGLLGHTIVAARRYQRQFAVLFIDLDRFKVINDTLGHGAGDVLLKEMSSRLKAALRSSDVVARLGGDEFVVLLEQVTNGAQAANVARKILSSVLQPATILGHECRVTASIGICMFPGDAHDEQSLMKNADIAMYYAKQEGKNTFQFFSTNIKAQSLERLELETNLRRALERNEFHLEYQAKQDLKTGGITGVEALLRWQSPALGSVSPAQFIPLAEETGLIVPIGSWVLRAACSQNVAWQRDGLPPICMAVNLSVRQFASNHLLEEIVAALRETGMDPRLLELEITEGMVVQNPERAVGLLRSIKKLGVRLAIDDFGTGYSSLGQLKNFPIDTLKVDRSFIRELPAFAEDKAITEAIIAMAKTLSLTVVAEGVETKEQADYLREHACDQMQGFYFSRPLIADGFAELLRKNLEKP